MSSPEAVPTPIRVAIVDDDAMARTGLSMIIQSAPDLQVVGEAEDGDQVPALVARQRPDVIIMDLQMKRVGGVEAIRLVTGRPNPPRVVVVTSFSLDAYVYDALRAGATGYLLKESGPAEIIEGVRRAAAGTALLAPAATSVLIKHFVGREDIERRRQSQLRVSALSPRERDVLIAVARGKTNAEIAAELFLSEATVKTHLTRMFTKLGLSNRVQLAITAHSADLVTW